MSTPTQDAFDQFEKRSTTLAAYRTVVQTVAGPADLDIYVRATERFCGSDRREDAWRIWLGVAERARQLGRADIERDANEQAVAAAPNHAHVLGFLADAIASGRARAAALRRCGESGERETAERAQSFTDAAQAFADNGDEDEAVECWEALAALDAVHALAAARGLNALVQKLGSPSVLAARAGALLMRADGDVADELWTLSQSTAGLVDDAIVLDWVVRVVQDKPEWTQTVLHWSRGVRGASPRDPQWRALHRSWSEAVGDVETQHQALTEEASIKAGGDRAAILLRRAALEHEQMREPSRALATASEALAADCSADVVALLIALADDATCGQAAARQLCSLAEERGDTAAALLGQRVLSSVDDSDASQLALSRRLHAAGETAEQMAVLARLVRRTPGASTLVAALLEAAAAIPAWPDAADALSGSSVSAWPADLRSECLQALVNAERWPAFFRAALTLGSTESVTDDVLRQQRPAAFAVLDDHSEADAERALWLSRLAAAFGANDPDLWPHILDLAPSQASLLISLPDAVAAAREAGDETRIERVLELQAGTEALQLESDLLELARGRGDTATADRWAEAILTEDPSHALASRYASSRWEAAPDIAERLLALGIDTLDPEPRALRHSELASHLAPTLDSALPHWLAAASIEEQSEASRMSAWRAALELATNSVDAEALAALAGQRGLPGSAAAALDERLDELWAFGEGELVEQLVVAAASAFADTQFQDRLAVSAYREGRWQDAVDAWNALELDPESDRASLLLAARLRATDAGSAPELVDDVLALLGRMPAAPDVVEAARELPDHALIAERFVAECATAHPESVAHWETAAALGAGTEHQVRAWLGWLAADPSAAHPAACIEDGGDDEAKRSALRLRLVSAGEAEGVALRLALAELEADDDAREALLLDVLQLDLGDISARRALAQIYERTERSEEAATLWEEIASFTDDHSERIAALHHVARLFQASEGDPRALEALEQVLNLDPQDDQAREALEQAYTMSGNNEGLAALWGRIAASVQDAERQLVWLKKAAALHESGEQPQLAMPYLVRALGIEPANLSLLERVATLQNSAGEWDALLSTLERIAEATPMAEVQNEVLVRAFRVLHRHLDRHEHALDLMRAACAHMVPADDDLDMMADAADATDDWSVWADAMADVLRNRERGARREQDLRTLVGVLDGKLGRTQDAVLWLVEDIASHPNLDGRLDRAEELADALGSRKPLVPAYKALAETSQPAATRWRAYRGSASLAEEAGGEVIAFGILEQGLALGSPHRDEAVEALRSMGQAPACHAEWQRVLTRLAREHSSPADLYMERARLEHEHLGDWREAMESCLYALRYDAFAVEATALVERIANENDAWSVLAQALSRLRDAASEEQHAEYDRWLARINAEQLGDAASAFALHEQAWRQDPSSTEARRLFVHAAEDLGFEERALRLVVNETPSDAESAKAWCDWVVPHALAKGQVDVALEQLRATVTALGDQADNWVPGTQRYWHQMSPADGAYAWFIEYSRDVDSDAACVAVLQAAARFAPTDTLKADALHAIAELAPDDGATRDALWLALDAAGRHEELSESLRVAALAEGSDDEATALALRAVHHARRAEHDAGHQAAVLASLVERLPRHEELRDDYELALREAEAWLPLVESLADRCAFADSPQAAEAFWLRGADLLDGIVEDAAAAAAFLQRAHDAGHDTPEVVRRRAALHEACGDWTAVVADGEVLAGVLDGAPAAHALGQSALLSETRLGDASRAADLWRRALDLSADWKRPHLRLALIHEANGVEESAYQHLDAAEALPSSYEATDVPDVCALLVRRASADAERAEAWLRRALELSAGHDLALRALVEHLCACERHADAAAALEDAAAVAAPAQAVVMHLERAGLLMHAADDPVAAAKAVGRARALAPESRAVAAVEGDVHLAAERFPDAVEAYHLALGFEESLPDDVPEPQLFVQHETPATPLTLYLTRYALALEASGRARDAYDAFQSATLEDDGHPLALAGLARVAHGRDERDAHARYRQELAAVTERGPSAVSALLDALPAFD